MKKILFYNFLTIIFLLISFFIIFEILNIFLSGQPRYWEIVHDRNFEKMKINKEKIIQIKRKNNKIKYLSVLDQEYLKLGYSGGVHIHNCGAEENGFYQLIYQTDKYGFRENIDERYINSDFILLGDSFTASNCENKPNDLKSNLLRSTKFSYLNLGKDGTDYAEQYLLLKYYSNDTKFSGLIWFFYEGNDYEQKSYNISLKVKPPEINLIDEINYKINLDHEISFFFRFKVWFAELIRGASVLIKFFKSYDNLLDKSDYSKVVNDTSKFLDQKNIEKKYIVYIPSWQKLSLFKLQNLKLYENHPQIIQLNNLKQNVKETANKYGFKFIDTENYFFKLDNPLSVFHYELNTHFNGYGYKILSDSLTNSITN